MDRTFEDQVKRMIQVGRDFSGNPDEWKLFLNREYERIKEKSKDFYPDGLGFNLNKLTEEEVRIYLVVLEERWKRYYEGLERLKNKIYEIKRKN